MPQRSETETSNVKARCVVFVHAHPDDEALATGGTIARYAAEGAHVVLITCTNGEAGEVAEVPELGSIEEISARLGEVRRDELVEACRRLGDIDLRMLDYHDSGMAGTPENDAPVAFINQDIDAVVARVTGILKETHAQVVVTYNEYGAYGHPDHIRAHEVAMLASEIAGVAKVYYTAFQKSLMRMGSDLAEAFGIDREDFFTEEEIEKIGIDDADITTTVDCRAFVEQKFAALEAHRTQLGTTNMFLQIPSELRGVLGDEHYQLARSSVGQADGTEADLFERL